MKLSSDILTTLGESFPIDCYELSLNNLELKLTQNQFDALLLLTINVGINRFKNSKLYYYLKFKKRTTKKKYIIRAFENFAFGNKEHTNINISFHEKMTELSKLYYKKL